MPLGDSYPGRCRPDPSCRRSRPMPMLAELVDAVVGVDTHRDSHEVEIALPTGSPIATCAIRNDAAGYAELLTWVRDHTPGPRLVVAIEGTRSYGVGLARMVAAVGLPVSECERPHRKARRGKRQVRPDRRTPRGSDRTASGRRPSTDTSRRRRPRSTAHPARSPPGPHRHRHRADQPIARAAADRRRHRPPVRPRRAHRRRPHRTGPPTPTPRRHSGAGYPPGRDSPAHPSPAR